MSVAHTIAALLLLLSFGLPCMAGPLDDPVAEQLKWYREQQRLRQACEKLITGTGSNISLSTDPFGLELKIIDCMTAGLLSFQDRNVPTTIPSRSQIAVPLKLVGGVFVVPVELNGAVRLDFAVDSGASDVVVPFDVFTTLKRTGTIRDSDLLETQTYMLADGSKSEQVRFTIRQLKVGSVVLNNVLATVSPPEGGLLLGQSFLGRFKSWSINNASHELHLECSPNYLCSTGAIAPYSQKDSGIAAGP